MRGEPNLTNTEFLVIGKHREAVAHGLDAVVNPGKDVAVAVGEALENPRFFKASLTTEYAHYSSLLSYPP